MTFNPYFYVKEKLEDGLGHSKIELSEVLLKEKYSQEAVDNIFKAFSVDWNDQLQKRTKELIDYERCHGLEDLSNELLKQGFAVDEIKKVLSDSDVQKQMCYKELMSYIECSTRFWTFDHLSSQIQYEGFTEELYNDAVKMMTTEDFELLYKNNLQHVMAWYCTQGKCTKDDLVGYLAEKDADSEMCSYIFEHGNFDFAEHEQTKAENSEPDDEFDFPSDIDYSSM